MLNKELWVRKKTGSGKGGVKIVILSTSTSTQIPNHKISKKRKKKTTSANNTVNKLLDRGVEKNYKMFANPVFITLGIFIFR